MFHCAVEGPDSVILWMHFYILSDTQPPTDEITSTLKPRVGKIDKVELEIKNAIQIRKKKRFILFFTSIWNIDNYYNSQDLDIFF